MNVKSLSLFLAFLLNGIVAFAQYTLYVGEGTVTLSAPTGDSSHPDFNNAVWEITGGSSCLAFASASGQYTCSFKATSTGKATVRCTAWYYNARYPFSDPIYGGYAKKCQTYTITCLSRDPGPGPTPDPDPYPDPDEDDDCITVKNDDGIPIRYYVGYNGGTCLTVTGNGDASCVPQNTVGTVRIPAKVNGYPVYFVGNAAFYRLYNVTAIEFPSSIRQFSLSCILSCPNIESITILRETPPECEDGFVFNEAYSTATLYVPRGSKELYARTKGYTYFKNIVEIGTAVTSIKLNTTEKSLRVGDTFSISATVLPSDASDKNVTWSSSNTSVATVSTTGLVTAKAAGSATVTCTANDGSGVSATCAVSVLDKVSDYSINTSEAGYATFYSSQSAYKLPKHLTAKVATGFSDNRIIYSGIGDIVPRNTAVLLENDMKRGETFVLVPSDNSIEYTGNNYLSGSDEAGYTYSSGSNYYYKLTYGNGSNSDVFGWYWGASNGGAFQIEGHKAWLALPKSMSRSVSFSVEGDMIEAIDEIKLESSEQKIYDLQGRRVNHKSSGVYIVNGKKQIVR